ncbi:hypothetical protein [Demequina sp. B12]|uniref:hypothetical protein n=1 Tax=Demequina sp. B12 TaxID=2992757 RepID=UPI0034E0BA71
MSGALDGVNSPEWTDEYLRTFGTREQTRGSDNDLVHLARTADPTTLPALKAWCGTEDFLLDQNRAFTQAARDNNVGLEYHESPGDHEWGAWDREIQSVLDWLPVKDPA